ERRSGPGCGSPGRGGRAAAFSGSYALTVPNAASDPENAAARHVHATAMASFVRDVTENADLWDYRVLSAGGLAPVGNVAQALDAALRDAADAPALVVNLSLGIAPEFSNPTLLSRTDGSCRTIEDGVGESLRFVLDVARQRDKASAPRVSVFAAAGNRAGPVPAELFQPVDRHPDSPCGPAAADDGQHSFIPALYGEIPSCRSEFSPPSMLATPVGAVDATDRPSVVSIDLAEPPLVAPGQNVYAGHPGLNANSPGINCQSEVGPAAGVDFPMPFTGTSVSTALVAGAAARAQQERIAAGEAPLNAAHLTRVLYLTGEATCRSTNAIPVRRLSVARLETALTQCDALILCAEHASESVREVDEKTLPACAAELAACGLETLNELGEIEESCKDLDPVRSFPEDLLSRLTCADDAPECIPVEPGCVERCGPKEIEGGVCTAAAPTPTPIDRHLLGSTGPQPETSGCLDCGAQLMQSSMTLMLMLNPYLPPETEFESPSVSLTNSEGTTVATLPLEGMTNADEWHPGGVAIVPDVDLASACEDPACLDALSDLGNGASLEMHLGIQTGGQSGLDTSPLTVY
ncbi:MAG: S8 family serine peptidase, partial [Myxococcota bacterium]